MLLWGQQQDRLGRSPVSSGTTAFLEKRLGRFRQVGVDDRADVALVHPHSVGTGRCQHRISTFEKLPFDRLFPLSGEAGVVKERLPGRKACPKPSGNHLRLRSGAAENQRRSMQMVTGVPHRERSAWGGRFRFRLRFRLGGTEHALESVLQ